ncbi:MAG: MucR family transcriptional regulator [Acetobacteraceae bacterium]|nr:MucR family transcriptional regulator [Acetobacteraceae bacterium]
MDIPILFDNRTRTVGKSTKVAEPLDLKALAEMTTQIVSAYVSHHPLRSSDVPALIGAVANRMASLANEDKEAPPPKPEPAVAVRRSVERDSLVCLVCGKRMKTLRRHLAAAHGLTPAAYREMFGLPRDYPVVAPAYAERRADIARRSGLGGPPKAMRRGAGSGAGGAVGGGRRRGERAPAGATTR